MFLVAIKGVLARKLRLLLTSIAIVLGVGFVSGAFLLTDSMRDSFDTLFDQAVVGIDVEVRTDEYKALTQSANQGSGVPIDLARVGVAPATIEQVRAIDGVELAVGSIFEIGAQPLGKDGEPLGGFGPPAFAANWIEEAADLGALRIARGDAPGADEVLLDETTFEKGGFTVGDDIDVLIQGGRKRETFRISGVVRFGDRASLNGASITVFETSTAQRLLDMGDRFSALDVTAEEGIGKDELRDRIDAVLDDDFDVVTGPELATEQSEAIDSSFLDILQNVILAFAAIAVFVGAFTIFNTFTILIGQRTREFGLLRILGARRPQILGIVALEALVLGVVASTIGIAAGYGIAALLRELLNAFDFGVPEGSFPLRSRTIVASYVVGVLVTLVASVVPAWRASHLSPLDAIRATSASHERGWKAPTFGLVLSLVGAASIVSGFTAGEDASINSILVRIGIGFLVGIVGLALLSRLFIAPVTLALSIVFGRGTTGQIATGNVLRNRARAATTSSALMIGLALASLVLVFYASLQETVENQIDNALGADITIFNGAFGGGATVVSDEVVEIVRETDGVEQVATQRWGSAMIGSDFDILDGDTTSIVAYDDGAVGVNEGLIRATLVDGEIDAGDGVVINEDVAENEQLDVGDEIELAFPTDMTRTLRVNGIFEHSDVVGGALLVSIETFDELQPPALRAAASVVVGVEEDVKPTTVVERIEQRVGDDAEYLEILDSEALRATFREQLAPILGLVFAMLSLSLVIALFGIGNTLALNVFERTREIGLLRAVGGTRRQLRRIIRVEAVLVALFGAVVGVLVGLGAGAALIAVLADEGFVFAANPLGLGAVLIGGFAAGLLASVLPARRAARTDVLQAIANE